MSADTSPLPASATLETVNGHSIHADIVENAVRVTLNSSDKSVILCSLALEELQSDGDASTSDSAAQRLAVEWLKLAPHGLEAASCDNYRIFARQLQAMWKRLRVRTFADTHPVARNLCDFYFRATGFELVDSSIHKDCLWIIRLCKTFSLEDADNAGPEKSHYYRDNADLSCCTFESRFWGKEKEFVTECLASHEGILFSLDRLNESLTCGNKTIRNSLERLRLKSSGMKSWNERWKARNPEWSEFDDERWSSSKIDDEPQEFLLDDNSDTYSFRDAHTHARVDETTTFSRGPLPKVDEFYFSYSDFVQSRELDRTRIRRRIVKALRKPDVERTLCGDKLSKNYWATLLLRLRRVPEDYDAWIRTIDKESESRSIFLRLVQGTITVPGSPDSIRDCLDAVEAAGGPHVRIISGEDTYSRKVEVARDLRGYDWRHDMDHPYPEYETETSTRTQRRSIPPLIDRYWTVDNECVLSAAMTFPEGKRITKVMSHRRLRKTIKRIADRPLTLLDRTSDKEPTVANMKSDAWLESLSRYRRFQIVSLDSGTQILLCGRKRWARGIGGTDHAMFVIHPYWQGGVRIICEYKSSVPLGFSQIVVRQWRATLEVPCDRSFEKTRTHTQSIHSVTTCDISNGVLRHVVEWPESLHYSGREWKDRYTLKTATQEVSTDAKEVSIAGNTLVVRCESGEHSMSLLSGRIVK